MKKTSSGRAAEQHAYRVAPRRLPEEGDASRVAAELFNVLSHPSQRGNLILQTEIAPERRMRQIPADQQATTIVVTGTNASRQAINARIHALRGLEGKGQRCQLLSRHDTTRAERSVARYYTVGDIVVPERDYQCGLKRGELYRVISTPRHDRITVQTANPGLSGPTPIEIIPRTMGKLSVYHLNESELSVGDQVRITRNNAQHDLVNGQLARVVAIEASTVTIETGDRSITLPTERPLHLDYAYTTTAHSAQGLTCDRVLYNAESFSRTTAQDTYYVSISRERHEVVVFTDDADKLPERVDRLGVKGLAHDISRLHQGLPIHGAAKAEIQPAEPSQELVWQ